MRSAYAAILGVCALLACPTAAAAQSSATSADTGQAFRVDDSGTLVLDPYLEMQGQSPGGAGSGSPLISASTRVSVQLNLAPWLGRNGRIYMTLPRTPGPTVRATWSTGGKLLPGTLLSADRAVVYSGPITTPLFQDIIEIRLEADASKLVQPEALAFGFEIEIDQ